MRTHVHPSSKVINKMLSSNLYDFWKAHKIPASGHFPCKIYWHFALTRSAPGSKCSKCMFFQIKFEDRRYFHVEIWRNQMKFSKLHTWYVFLISPKFHGDWPNVTKLSTNKCRSLCKLISNSMHVDLGQTNDGIAIKLRHHRLEWVLHPSLKVMADLFRH